MRSVVVYESQTGCTHLVAELAETGVSILVVEQFARTVLGVADLAAIMVNGRVTRVGEPADLEEELSAAYLGASS